MYVSVSRDTKVTFREFDMEDIPNVEILFSFMKATQNILAEKIISELKKYGITNCGCDITYKREPWDDNPKKYDNIIKVKCHFQHKLNDW